MTQLLADTQLQSHPQILKTGTMVTKLATHILYNPWSILNCIDEKGATENLLD